MSAPTTTLSLGHEQDDLPEELRLIAAEAPLYIDRRAGADLISRHLFRVSPRTLEKWKVPGRNLNGRFQSRTDQLLTMAWEKLRTAEADAA